MILVAKKKPTPNFYDDKNAGNSGATGALRSHQIQIGPD